MNVVIYSTKCHVSKIIIKTTRLWRNDYLEIFSLLTFCTFAMICLISGFPDLWDSTFNGGGSQHLGAGSPFDGSGSQVVDLKSEVPERRSGPIEPLLQERFALVRQVHFHQLCSMK